MKVYTFGHPRLANKAFDDALTNQVKDAYRVVHWKDLVAHVPPCIAKPVVGKSSCLTDGTLSPIYPFHTMTEVFYTEDESSYEVCSTMEQRSCSNQFLLGNVENHLVYFGIQVGQASKTPIS